jgi:hypothetical protein
VLAAQIIIARYTLTKTAHIHRRDFFVEVSAADASRMMDLTQEEQYVFHIIEKSKDVGLWTREIKKHSRISGQSEISSILERLLQKTLVTQVKDIQNKTQKNYMLYTTSSRRTTHHDDGRAVVRFV